MKINSTNISVPPYEDQYQNNSNQFIPMQTYGYANVSHSSSLSRYISPNTLVMTFKLATPQHL